VVRDQFYHRAQDLQVAVATKRHKKHKKEFIPARGQIPFCAFVPFCGPDLVRREWRRLQSKCLRILTNDCGGEKSGDVERVFGRKGLVHFAAIGSQRTDAASSVLLVEEDFQRAGGLASASIV
jgi:hypothetical protein